MRWKIHRIEITPQYYVSGHIAFCKAFRVFILCSLYESYSVWTFLTNLAAIHREALNAYQATDHPQFCGIGRFFCFSEKFLRCRSPPNQFELIVPFTPIDLERIENEY